jgi:putative oxidoreductase
MMTDTMAHAAGSTLRGRLDGALEWLERCPLSVILLLCRLGVASVFMKAGITKLQGWEFTVQLFADEYKVPVLPPDVAALMATSFELGCASLLIAGFLTRLATLPLFGMILTIQVFVYPSAWSEHLVWGSILVFVLTRGPGAISLDRLLGLERGAPRA